LDDDANDIARILIELIVAGSLFVQSPRTLSHHRLRTYPASVGGWEFGGASA
jgi:hypothetical protein